MGQRQCRSRVFRLNDIDTDTWAEKLKSTGSTGIIFTAKHHDGFCLFPSAYTDYTIAATGYRNGKGDLVKQLAESCKKYGLNSVFTFPRGTDMKRLTVRNFITIFSVIN